MAHSLTWLPKVLLDANLKVATVDGWETRGHGDVGPTFGVLCHHTGGRKDGNMPALNTLIKGRTGHDGKKLEGPLSQLGLGRDGTYYVIAAGRAYHAGKGLWMGASGNHHFIGIEAENTGRTNDPWPEIQMDAYRRGVAAILKHTGLSAERCAGHKEYAQPRGRKPDPSFDMAKFRADVATLMGTNAIRRELIATETNVNGVKRRTVRRGDHDDCIHLLQTVLGLVQTGRFDEKTEAKVREFQRKHELVPDGIVGPRSWRVFEAAMPTSDPPQSSGSPATRDERVGSR